MISNYLEMYRRPIVTLIGGGDEIALDGVGEGWTLKPGSTGLGVAPREITAHPLASGGSVVRHRRSTDREIFLPIDVHFGADTGEYALLEDARRRIENVCDDLVEIRVEGKDGSRSAFGYLQSGLEGKFSTADVNLRRMVLGLTFSCPDPLWYGEVREFSQGLMPSVKPFLSSRTPMRSRRNLIPNPGVEYGRAGFTSSSGAVLSVSNDAVSGEGALRVDAVGGQPILSTPHVQVTADAVTAVGVQVKASPGVTHVRVTGMSMAGSIGVLVGPPVDVPVGGDWTRISRVFPAVIRPNISVEFQLRRDDGGTLVPAAPGEWAIFDEFILEESAEVGEFFDGDTPDTPTAEYTWDGVPGESSSSLTAEGTNTAFFPVILSPSTVQGAFLIHIEGDEEVWPEWTITGPGLDLIVRNDTTGERIFIEGEVTELIRIVTRPQEQDILTPSQTDGQMWERVSPDSTLFSLAPGENRIRVSMVNSTEDSRVLVTYRQTYRAGH